MTQRIHDMYDDGARGDIILGDDMALDPRILNQEGKPYRRILDSGSVGGTNTLTTKTTGPSDLIALIKVGPGDEPEPLTIFGQAAPGADRSPQDDIFLRVRWGVKNFQAEADVDLQRGTMLSIYADAVEVVAGSGIATVAATAVKVAASISYGVRAGHAPPQRTKAGGSVAPAGNGARVTIPNYARGVYPMPLVTTVSEYAADFVVVQLDKNLGILSEHPYIFSGAPYLSPTRLMLLNDAVFLEAYNVDAANTFTMNWLFDLAL